MGKKLALNVLYTVGLVICIFTAYWGVENKRYEFVIGAACIGALFMVLKIRLLKDVKNSQKKP